MKARYFCVMKEYISVEIYKEYRNRYKECVRMLNGLEKSLERNIPEKNRKWNETDT